jgi:hypothetical protein
MGVAANWAMPTLLRDLRLGVRLLLKAPAFTTIAMLARFGADPGVLEKAITLGGEPSLQEDGSTRQYLVVGVLPALFRWLDRDVQLFVPVAFEPRDSLNSHNNYFLNVIGRRGPITSEQARLEVQASEQTT